MNTSALIQLNNEKRKQLTKENKKYYMDMVMYLRSSRVSEQQSEELALELLEHLIVAQEEGRTAEEVFGHDPKEYCQELVSSLPKKTMTIKSTILRYVKMVIIFFTAYFFANSALGILSWLIDEPFSINIPLDYLVVAVVCTFFFIELFFIVMKKSVFNKKAKYVLYFIGASLLPFFVGVAMLSNVISAPEIYVSTWLAFVLGCIGLLINRFGMQNVDI